LPVILGPRLAKAVAVALIVGQYLVVGWLIARGTVTPVLGVVILAAAAGWAAIKVFDTERPEVPPADYPPDVWPLWYAPYAFVHTRLFGLLFFVGVIVDALWAQFR
jgi:1,4-dihydroxy-2-naphthoate octaprenyltransferase